ncbi:MAG: bifunctional glutamate N-acetyltransferase/amino-acid acetyltransferase ArgJ [Hyphomicrobiaceae bacterium]|nr:bifunctional glutamate N-acetyltransferase/amino-acid acetyltransferase ArgJ [Hyphomicrobiaceae bacterium]
MSHAVSPLAPKSVPTPGPIAGVRFATAGAGIKYKGRTDVLMLEMAEGTTAAGVFTRSKCPSAPVDWCRKALASGKARALVVNSGNANAFTGARGVATVTATAEGAASLIGCGADEVYLASTGVIGEPLDPQKILAVLPDARARMAEGPWIEPAKAIMTTDTFPKLATATARIDGVEVAITGIAKGAGMIAPDMATMLSFVFTDAAIAAPALQALLDKAVVDSFNAVTVDGDTSTSDTLMLFATGAAAGRGAPLVETAADRRLAGFRKALQVVVEDLAQMVARDGEGARKLVEIEVTGATSKKAARRIAMSIANSPLVKTAVAGEDANWGRVVMAVGKAGEVAERDKLTIWFGDVRVAVAGARDPDYSEDAASAVMRRDVVPIRVDLGLGKARDRVWTCDLTKEYVAINGDYRS